MDKRFLKYYFSVFISNIGNACMIFVLPIFILELTDSVAHLSIISALQLIPFLIFGLPFGAIVDKVNIKKLMQVCDFIRCINYILLFIIICLGKKEAIIVYVYISAIISGLCYVFHTISESTLLSNLISDEKLAAANSLIFGIQYATNCIVPIVSGIPYNGKNVEKFILFDAITFLVSCVVLHYVNVEDSQIPVNRLFVKMDFSDIIQDIKEGIVLLLKDKKMFKMLVIIALSNLIIASYYTSLLDYMKNDLQFTSYQIGIVDGIYSLGALCGASVVNLLIKKMKYFNILIFCIGIDAVFRLFVPISKSITMLTGLMFIIEMTSAIINIMVITIRQKNIRKEYLGRINSVFKTVLIGATPIGLVIGGGIMEFLGTRNNMICIAILCLMLFEISIFMLKER